MVQSCLVYTDFRHTHQQRLSKQLGDVAMLDERDDVDQCQYNNTE